MRLKKQTITFGNQREKWYDLEFDRELIIQSIAKQYGILPEDQEELPFPDWTLLLGGIMEDTPLGQIVLIRKENDKKKLKNFGKYEHHIRNQWRNFCAGKKLNEVKDPEIFAADFEKMFAGMFGGENKNG